MLTKKEQNQLTVHFEKVFVTKDYADKTFATKDALEDLRNDMANGFLEAKHERDEFKKEMLEFKDEMYEFRDEMLGFKKDTLSGFAEIMHELKAIREELTVGAYRRSENFDTLTNHNERIKKLEYTTGAISV